MDIVTPARRSEIMARIQGRDTVPEMMVRRTAHRLGEKPLAAGHPVRDSPSCCGGAGGINETSGEMWVRAV